MTYADINKMFTAEVSKYLARGYHFNTASMSGSQGETAKVDLTNGTEIIRVLLRTFSDGWDKQGTELFVGRVAEKENVRRDVAYCVNTIWNNRLEIPTSSMAQKRMRKPLARYGCAAMHNARAARIRT